MKPTILHSLVRDTVLPDYLTRLSVTGLYDLEVGCGIAAILKISTGRVCWVGLASPRVEWKSLYDEGLKTRHSFWRTLGFLNDFIYFRFLPVILFVGQRTHRSKKGKLSRGKSEKMCVAFLVVVCFVLIREILFWPSFFKLKWGQ